MPVVNSRWQQDAAFSYPFAIVAVFGLAAVGGMALLAAGQLGRIQLLGAPVDGELVLNSVWHSVLGCALTSIQWGAGAGLALWLYREINPPLGRLLLLGFPLSLIVLGAWSTLVLALPFGWIPGTGLLIACFAAFLRQRPRTKDLRQLGRVMLSIVPMSVLLGCWMGFLAHGPTANLTSHPPGDVSFYASSMYSLQVHPFPFVNYANEGETLLPFNMLHSMLGAALMRFFPLDPFQFVLATGASMYVFGLGLALHAYFALRSNIGTQLSYAVVVLAALVGTWYPLWVVASPPMIFALPLTISIWYQATADRSLTSAFTTFTLGVAGSALSKVTSVITLAPLSLATVVGGRRELLEQFRGLPKLIRIGVIGVAVVALSYAAFMLYSFGPYLLAAGGAGPESYERYGWAIQFHVGRRVVLPYLLRDLGTVLFVVLAFRMLSWPFATALAVGLTGALILPYFARVNLYCAVMVIALAGIDQPVLLRRSRLLAVAAYLLCLPAILQTDFGGHPSSAVWLLCVGSMVWIVSAHAPSEIKTTPLFTPQLVRFGTVMFALAGVFALGAVARQQIVFTGPADYVRIPPEAHDIWTAVRQRTPMGALIFTDQTGAEPYDALGGWNTYATTGQRQIYLAGWYQLPELRQSPQLLMERLRLNEAVLSGQMQPAKLHYRRGPYGDYFAVVSRARMMPLAWQKTYENGTYALYRYAPDAQKTASSELFPSGYRKT